ncbi:gal4-like Zn(II)2Cys6 binuclear cluster DNA-binding domain-containing protein [Thermochaetoides thermophila DSM 1495]|uniref:Gal4-like Zn(II)2Cys6 binuclear cluster DNA-binding domain-containing protein n=1 Tax=Chaetomium thermophilum (strain DSM 1495 / CBS 144.50 / IMI 039719) TaxID=759272 RepID=G0S4Z8_CHATD|nr:gal4-like Zn(II)2Cys6 binuclear cluster DNA-binding domain-containing protein [Thermochaetoides thermophila DSM 1495]EGS20523.1 gal4-like Zn(II)2Cys6 binuclear cluster DNA-binding domain-containing protein [Thermochaetoides thermophila DSM 1495]
MASASVRSVGSSPVSFSSYQQVDFSPSDNTAAPLDDTATGGDAELWDFVSQLSAGSVRGDGQSNGLLASPASVSQSLASSWVIVGPQGAFTTPSSQLPSSQEFDRLSELSGRVSLPAGAGRERGGAFGSVTSPPVAESSPFASQSLGQSGNVLFDQDLLNSWTSDAHFNGKLTRFSLLCWSGFLVANLFAAEWNILLSGVNNSSSVIEGQQILNSSLNLFNQQPVPLPSNASPWAPPNLRGSSKNNLSDLITGSLPSPNLANEDIAFSSPAASYRHSPFAISETVHTPASSGSAPPQSPSPAQVSIVREEPRRSPTAVPTTPPTTIPRTAPIPIIKPNNSAHRVQKRKASTATAVSFPSHHRNLSSSPAGSSGSGSISASPTTTSPSTTTANKFVVVTPSIISQHKDKPGNPWEEALASLSSSSSASSLRPTQRGRKGPLAEESRKAALDVRRKGACFHCHARKVGCDAQRPCKNCMRLAQQVPQVVCWRFPDFSIILFPEFIRGHLRKEKVAQFVADNVESFTVGGVEMPCDVELFSGFGMRAVLKLRAKFFTAKGADALQHWHAQLRNNEMALTLRGAAPIALEMGGMAGNDGGGSGSGDTQRSELKKKLKEYINAIVDEPWFPELMTPPPHHTEIPRKVLRIVHEYERRSKLPVVRSALSIYAMHYVMTRQLCMTRDNLAKLQPTGLVPNAPGMPFVTPRVLNRQIKAVLDDMMRHEMDKVFDDFARSVRRKMRNKWAPCLAAFLVLCLFMETVEVAADLFVISDTEIKLRQRSTPEWQRSFVLQVNQEIENMPFKQFAFQFHQVYQTHTRDATVRRFNPLLDDDCFEPGELEEEAADMVRKLRRLIDEDCRFVLLLVTLQERVANEMVTGDELDYLTADPILPNIEPHPYPRNVSYNYIGRLVTKFLLSFTDERYIFDNRK